MRIEVGKRYRSMYGTSETTIYIRRIVMLPNGCHVWYTVLTFGLWLRHFGLKTDDPVANVYEGIKEAAERATQRRINDLCKEQRQSQWIDVAAIECEEQATAGATRLKIREVTNA